VSRIYLLQLGAGSFKIRQVDAVCQRAAVARLQNDGRGHQATLGGLSPVASVRQIAKRSRPTVLVSSEIKALVDNLDVRERTLVLLAASTGLRQSEMFGLKWGTPLQIAALDHRTEAVVG
jgi:integrase